MPVIGRLDGQVDEVLIAPLEKRRRGGPAADERAELEKNAARNEFEKDAARDRPQKETAREELPVWLL